jgi:hypothetical protein
MPQTKNKVTKVLEKIRWFFVELWRAFWYLCRKSKPFATVLILIIAAGIFYGGVCFGQADVGGFGYKKSSSIGGKNMPAIPGMAEGKVIKNNDKSVTIKDLKGKSQSFTYDAKISVLASGKAIKLNEIKKDDSIRVYIKAGTKVAYRIMVIATKK